jgi:hypothetical protein
VGKAKLFWILWAIMLEVADKPKSADKYEWALGEVAGRYEGRRVSVGASIKSARAVDEGFGPRGFE